MIEMINNSDVLLEISLDYKDTGNEIFSVYPNNKFTFRSADLENVKIESRTLEKGEEYEFKAKESTPEIKEETQTITQFEEFIMRLNKWNKIIRLHDEIGFLLSCNNLTEENKTDIQTKALAIDSLIGEI